VGRGRVCGSWCVVCVVWGEVGGGAWLVCVGGTGGGVLVVSCGWWVVLGLGCVVFGVGGVVLLGGGGGGGGTV